MPELLLRCLRMTSVLYFCLFTLVVGSDLDEGSRERPKLSKDIDLNNFLRSHDFINTYEPAVKKLSYDILAYVTPWNSNGYEKAQLFAEKFTLISPVWFKLIPESYEIDGINNIDRQWMEKVKAANSKIMFAPRVIFENWNPGEYQRVLDTNEKRMECIKSLRKFIKENSFDGITIEVWMQHIGTSQRVLINFLIELAKGLHKDGKILILPIPPSIYKGNLMGRFEKKHFDMLVDYVDFFSLMTYDYSSPYAPGENAPINWAIQCIKNLVPDEEDIERRTAKRVKVLLGMNFYGNDYVPEKQQGRAVLGHDVLKVAKKYSPIFKWHDKCAEHSLEYMDDNNAKHSLFFPTPYSIARRVAVAQELGVGLSIWEIGQGFDSFFEQL